MSPVCVGCVCDGTEPSKGYYLLRRRPKNRGGGGVDSRKTIISTRRQKTAAQGRAPDLSDGGRAQKTATYDPYITNGAPLAHLAVQRSRCDCEPFSSATSRAERRQAACTQQKVRRLAGMHGRHCGGRLRNHALLGLDPNRATCTASLGNSFHISGHSVNNDNVTSHPAPQHPAEQIRQRCFISASHLAPIDT